MNLLSIQSHVTYGHVGNSAAVFPLQRIGHEVWPIHTVQFSSHAGYAGFKGRVFDGDMIRDLIDGIAAIGMLGRCDGIISGYLGGADIGEAILGAVARIKAANPAARYCCDPVIGDVGSGTYVKPEVAELMRRRVMRHADVVTPNQYELEFLGEAPAATLAQAQHAMDVLHQAGPPVVLVTSLIVQTTPADAIDLVASGPDGRFLVRTPKLPIAANGAGDAIAALFFAHWLRSRSTAEALSLASSSIFGVLRRTMEAGSRELLLVAAQDEFVTPSTTFEPRRID